MDYSVFDNFLDGILVIDENKKVVYANDTLALLCGLSINVKKGPISYDLISFDDPDLFCMPQGTVGKDQVSPYLEVMYKSSSGKTGRVQVSIQPEAKCPDPEKRWIVFVRDVTLEESLHRKYKSELSKKEMIIGELGRTQEQLVQSGKLAILGEFVANLSHELNNPLALIWSSAEEMIKGLKEKDIDLELIREMSKYIHIGTSRIIRLANHLKTFIHSPLELDNFIYVDLQGIVERAISFSYFLRKQSQIEVRNKIASSLAKTLLDPSLIEQLVINLIRNSVEAMGERPEGQAGLIEIDAKHDSTSNTLIISFQDNGPGMTAEILDKVFVPFFTTKAIGKGTGLGLSICSQIAEKHGGNLTVKSAPNEGTTFYLVLPVISDPSRISAKVNFGTAEPGRNVKVLLVEGENWMRGIQRRILTQLGCTIQEIPEGKNAIEACQEIAPEVILLNLTSSKAALSETLLREISSLLPKPRTILVGEQSSLEPYQSNTELFDEKVTRPFSNESLQKAVLGHLTSEP